MTLGTIKLEVGGAMGPYEPLVTVSPLWGAMGPGNPTVLRRTYGLAENGPLGAWGAFSECDGPQG